MKTVARRKGQRKITSAEYVYTVTLVVALCEGPIDTVMRMWADAELLDMTQVNYRLYKGDETQYPDPLIEAHQGPTPAYRSLAYIIIEDFPTTSYGNRIPNFTFEVKKRAVDKSALGAPALKR
jgi:hypothetical protein